MIKAPIKEYSWNYEDILNNPKSIIPLDNQRNGPISVWKEENKKYH